MANEPWTTSKRAQYIGRPICTAAITAQNQWTTPSYFSTDFGMEASSADITISIYGTFVATVTLQRSFDDGSNWHDVATYTAPTQTKVEHTNFSAKWRLGVKTGEFTSGTVNVRLAQA